MYSSLPKENNVLKLTLSELMLCHTMLVTYWLLSGPCLSIYNHLSVEIKVLDKN